MTRRRDSFFGAMWINVIFLAIFFIGLWAIGLFRFVGDFPKHIEDEISKTDAIVVLTGGSGRVNTGLELLEKKLAAKLFVSGVYQGIDVRKLLQIARRNPGDLGARIGIGNAVNTIENAIETAMWSSRHRIGSIRLVTAVYHMSRSILEFRHAMPNIKIIPNPVFPNHVKVLKWWAWPGTSALFIREYNKFLMAWVRVNSEKIFDPKHL